MSEPEIIINGITLTNAQFCEEAAAEITALRARLSAAEARVGELEAGLARTFPLIRAVSEGTSCSMAAGDLLGPIRSLLAGETTGATIEERLVALERVAHEPFDFSQLVRRIENLEAFTTGHPAHHPAPESE